MLVSFSPKVVIICRFTSLSLSLWHSLCLSILFPSQDLFPLQSFSVLGHKRRAVTEMLVSFNPKIVIICLCTSLSLLLCQSPCVSLPMTVALSHSVSLYLVLSVRLSFLSSLSLF